jgi:pimeloyl-ACP methyl ester carboxylesterase
MKHLIILHGWQSSKERWQKVKEEIERAGIRVIVPDIPGFKKETELNRPWNLNDYVNWFDRFIDDSKRACPELVEGFFLLGHSFGGRMTIKIAARGQNKNLKGVILVSAAGIKKQPSLCDKTLIMLAKAIKACRIERIPVLKQAFGLFRRFFYRYILGKTDYLRAQGFLKETFKNVIDEDLSIFLDKIFLPTLIIWGREDKLTPLKNAHLMKEKIKNSEIKILEDFGHDLNIKAPEKLAEEVIKFINSH